MSKGVKAPIDEFQFSELKNDMEGELEKLRHIRASPSQRVHHSHADQEEYDKAYRAYQSSQSRDSPPKYNLFKKLVRTGAPTDGSPDSDNYVLERTTSSHNLLKDLGRSPSHIEDLGRSKRRQKRSIHRRKRKLCKK